MAGSVTVYVERFQVHVARDLAGKPRMGMGRHHGVCGLFKFYCCFSPLMAETRASLPLEMTPAFRQDVELLRLPVDSFPP
jgi:hypothetical protein